MNKGQKYCIICGAVIVTIISDSVITPLTCKECETDKNLHTEIPFYNIQIRDIELTTTAVSGDVNNIFP